MSVDKIPLFPPNGDQDIGRRRNREDQMGCRHRWGGPERKQPAYIQGMAHVAIETRRLELQRRIGQALEIESYLPHAEQVEVIDQERRHEDQEPAAGKEA